jgi:hypothetical protein
MSAPSTPTPAQQENQRRQLRSELEHLLAEAYEIGHAHGMAPSLIAQGRTPTRTGDGWSPLVDQAMTAVERWA